MHRYAIAAALAGAALLIGAAASAQTPAPAPGGKAPVDILPADPVKPLVVSLCANCHELSNVTMKGRTPAEWNDTLGRMVAYGLPATDAQVAQIAAYLSKALPPTP